MSAEALHHNTSQAVEIAELRRQVQQLTVSLQLEKLKVQVLEERLRLQRIKKYGPGSEKLNAEQLELLELEPGVSNVEVEAESSREPLRQAANAAVATRRKHPGRQELPADLQRVEEGDRVSRGAVQVQGLR